jgi:hypothetical protein
MVDVETYSQQPAAEPIFKSPLDEILGSPLFNGQSQHQTPHVEQNPLPPPPTVDQKLSPPPPSSLPLRPPSPPLSTEQKLSPQIIQPPQLPIEKVLAAIETMALNQQRQQQLTEHMQVVVRNDAEAENMQIVAARPASSVDPTVSEDASMWWCLSNPHLRRSQINQLFAEMQWVPGVKINVVPNVVGFEHMFPKYVGLEALIKVFGKCVAVPRVRDNFVRDRARDHNILVVGPQGNGKRNFVYDACRLLNIEYILVSQSNYTTGNLLLAVDYAMASTPYLIYIDDFDELCRTNSDFVREFIQMHRNYSNVQTQFKRFWIVIAMNRDPVVSSGNMIFPDTSPEIPRAAQVAYTKDEMSHVLQTDLSRTPGEMARYLCESFNRVEILPLPSPSLITIFRNALWQKNVGILEKDLSDDQYIAFGEALEGASVADVHNFVALVASRAMALYDSDDILWKESTPEQRDALHLKSPEERARERAAVAVPTSCTAIPTMGSNSRAVLGLAGNRPAAARPVHLELPSGDNRYLISWHDVERLYIDINAINDIERGVTKHVIPRGISVLSSLPT